MKQLIKNIWESPKSSLVGISIIASIVLISTKVITIEQVTTLGGALFGIYKMIQKDENKEQ